MSNQTYEQGLYNEEQKSMYLKDLNQNTRAAYLRILNRAKKLEEQYQQDLYDFNLPEIESLMNYLSPRTLNSATSSASIIQNYIRWAIEQGLRRDNLNPLDAVFGDEFYGKFIDSSNKILFSEEEIEDIAGGLVNYQDRAIVHAIFEGIMGRMCSELLNLKISDIDSENGLIRLRNEIRENEIVERILELNQDSKLPKILELANNEKEYFKSNGNPEPTIKKATSELVDNGYIFKVSFLNNKKSGGRADQHLILRRLKKISEWYDEPYFTAINIRNSGMLKMAKDLLDRDGELGIKQMSEIAERFNLQRTKDGALNMTRLKKDFLNINKISELYGEE